MVTTSGLDIPVGYVNVMGHVAKSQVNGPGCRAVIWVQGCGRRCLGCFNPQSWPFRINQLISVTDLVSWILEYPEHEGVTFSGGEPFWQAMSLAEVARQVKAAGLSTMSFSGFTLAELQSATAPPGAQTLLSTLDILVDGPFVESQAVHTPDSPVASWNQQIHIFNPYLQDQITWASDQVEIHILKDGSRIVTGYQGSAFLQDDAMIGNSSRDI
jgi:anaerobic ribonucleoside-triphosphate reductase activating protein